MKVSKVISAPTFIPDFNLLSCELGNFILCYIELLYSDILLT